MRRRKKKRFFKMNGRIAGGGGYCRHADGATRFCVPGATSSTTESRDFPTLSPPARLRATLPKGIISDGEVGPSQKNSDGEGGPSQKISDGEVAPSQKEQRRRGRTIIPEEQRRRGCGTIPEGRRGPAEWRRRDQPLPNAPDV